MEGTECRFLMEGKKKNEEEEGKVVDWGVREKEGVPGKILG